MRPAIAVLQFSLGLRIIHLYLCCLVQVTSIPFQNMAMTTSSITPTIILLINNSHILQIQYKQIQIVNNTWLPRLAQLFPTVCLFLGSIIFALFIILCSPHVVVQRRLQFASGSNLCAAVVELFKSVVHSKHHCHMS